MKYNVVNLILKTDSESNLNPSKIRGYIGNEFSKYSILHNHVLDGKYLYSYPLVQYKVINGVVLIQGLDEGGEVLKNIYQDINSLKLEKEYKITEKIIQEKEFDIKPSSEEKHYKFITPWIGLNQENYKKFNDLKSWKDRKILLNNILVGNFLSLSKGLGIIVNKRLYVKSHFEETQIQYKSIFMKGFIGEFKIHYDIPDYFGLGKGVSQGFGCVKQIYGDE